MKLPIFTDVFCIFPEDPIQAKITNRGDSLGTKWFLDKDGNWEGPINPSGLYAGCNSKYRYALFLDGKKLTDYLYHYIYQPDDYTHEASEPFLFGVSDTGYMVMDTLGKLIYPFAVDRVWKTKYAEGAYVCNRDENWGIFSLNNKYYYPMSYILNGWKAFHLDDLAYTDLKDPFIVKKKGKWGMESLNGVTIPFENDKLFEAYPGKSLVRLKDGKWELIKKKKTKVIRELDIEGLVWCAIRRGKVLRSGQKKWKDRAH